MRPTPQLATPRVDVTDEFACKCAAGAPTSDHLGGSSWHVLGSADDAFTSAPPVRDRDLSLAPSAVSIALFIAVGGLGYWAFGSPRLPNPLGAAERLEFNSALVVICLSFAVGCTGGPPASSRSR